MLSAIIIDDEQDAISVLSRSLVTAFGAEIKIIGTTTQIKEGVLLIKEYNPDLIFLDILLGDNISGFDILPLIEDLDYAYKIIFTTGFHQFAIKAIKKGAYDYLLKPIGVEELVELKNRLEVDLSVAEKNDQKDIIIINTTDATYKIEIKNISHFKGEGNYTSIFMAGKSKPILTSVTLNNFETEINLVSQMFYRTHKSFLVNLSQIEYIKKNGINRSLVMKNGETANVSRLKYKDFAGRYL